MFNETCNIVYSLRKNVPCSEESTEDLFRLYIATLRGVMTVRKFCCLSLLTLTLFSGTRTDSTYDLHNLSERTRPFFWAHAQVAACMVTNRQRLGEAIAISLGRL